MREKLNSSRSVALITGGSSGIGWEIAAHLASQGKWHVVILTRDPERTIARLRHAGIEDVTSVIGSNVADLEGIKEIETELKPFGPVHLLINNASGWFEGSLGMMNLDQIPAVLSATLGSAMLVTRIVANQMKESGRGHILFLGSTVGTDLRPSPNTAFNTAKWGVRGLAKSLRRECWQSGIRVTLMSLGRVEDLSESDTVEAVLPVGAVIRAIDLAIELRPQATVDEIVMTPTWRDY